jgi:hypothetical protein
MHFHIIILTNGIAVIDYCHLFCNQPSCDENCILVSAR